MRITPLTLKEMFYQGQIRPFPNYLNLWSIEDNAIIGVDLGMSLAYELSGINLLLTSEAEAESFFNQVKNFLHAIPEEITIQFVLQVRVGAKKKIERYVSTVKTKEDFSRFIVDEKVEYLKSQNPYSKRLFMCVTSYPEGTDLEKLGNPIFKFFVPDYKKLAQEMHEKRIRQLNEIANIFTQSLSSIGIKIHLLEKEEIVEFLYEYLNPGRSEYLEPRLLNDELTLRSQLVLNAGENQFSYFFLDGYYHRAVNMHLRPQEISFNQIIEYSSQIPGEFDIAIAVHTTSQEKIEKKLASVATAATIIGTVWPFKRYHEAEIMAQHANQLVEDTKNTFQKFYTTSFWIVLRDTTLESLTQRTNKAVAEFRTIGDAEGVVDDMNHMFSYLALLPNHSHLNQTQHIFQTEAIVQMLLLHQEWKGSKEPKMIFLTRNHELLPIDLFDPELSAKHALVVGSTGAGKSFTMNYILTNFFIESESNYIVIIDIGGSYKKLCNLFKGEYFEVELSEKYAFNPFPAKDIAIISQNPFELDPDIITYLKLLAQKLLNKPTLTGEESMILEQAVVNAYKYTKQETPLLSSFQYQLENFEGIDDESKRIAKQFAKNLSVWTQGIYSKVLNKPTSIDPTARIMVFDLQKLQEHKTLMPIMFFLIQNVIARKLYDKSLKKIIVFDESWKFFNDPVSAELIENLFRTGRKYNCAVYSISQSPEDFLQSSASSAVLNNSYLKFVLRLQKGHELLEKFGLNAQETEVVKSLVSVRGEYSEIFLKFGQAQQVLKIQPSLTDYWIATTDPEDQQIIDKITSENPQISQIELIKKLKEIKK